MNERVLLCIKKSERKMIRCSVDKTTETQAIFFLTIFRC